MSLTKKVAICLIVVFIAATFSNTFLEGVLVVLLVLLVIVILLNFYFRAKYFFKRR